MSSEGLILAGVPLTNLTLYHRIQFAVGDSAAFLGWDQAGKTRTTLLVREIEMARAQRLADAQTIGCAADYPPLEGLSGDRDTALAQAAAECLRRAGVTRVRTDRSLPYIFAWHLQKAGLELAYDPELGVRERRVKRPQELAWLREAQEITEAVMQMACETIAHAEADAQGVLIHEGQPLTSERLRSLISIDCLQRGYSNHRDSIVATVPQVADCHHHGSGPLRTGLPVIVDIFPQNKETLYWGDCTRTVVHGDPSDAILQMHRAVLAAKQAATAALRPGATGQEVHQATAASMQESGYAMGPPPPDADEQFVSMRHGTGHGIGLDVHEPILLDQGAGPILESEVFTIEPGLYSRAFGGVRVEDMVAVGADGPVNFNRLPEGLCWK